MNKINLSYVITTYNKLPYLKNVLETLLQHVKPDEEIVITDGASTDGTVEYLKDLLQKGKIHQFVSEKDYGEAHGWNKSFLLTKGKLIKIITDDDVFDYNEIKKCKDFMLSHLEIDFLGTEGIFTKSVSESSFIHSKNYSQKFFNINSDHKKLFSEWKNEKKPFSFCGLGWMLRKSSIPLFGLMDTSFVRVDAEFTVRLTSGKANLAWYTGRVWARVFNPNSNSLTQNDKIIADTLRINRMYPGTNLDEGEKQKKWYDYLPKNIVVFLRKIKKIKKIATGSEYKSNDEDWANVFNVREKMLEELNKENIGEFLYRNRND